jgi:hypothetical protein
MPGTAVVMSIGSLIAAGALLFLRLRPEPPEAVRTESASVSAPPMAAAATAAGAR